MLSTRCLDGNNRKEDNASAIFIDHVLQPPAEFPFPYTPYDIQRDFMRNLYKVLENGGLGIFESPTGTGKSQSIICGALAWLRDHERRSVLPAPVPAQQTQSDPYGWVDDFFTEKAAKEEQEKARALQEAREAAAQRVAAVGEALFAKKKKVSSIQSRGSELLDIPEAAREARVEYDDDLVLDYNSDVEKGNDVWDVSTDEEDDQDPAQPPLQCTKIIYSSRTHSQIAQFIGEIRRSPYGATTRVAVLGSRQHMCINDRVKRLGSVAMINDRCLELKEEKKKGKGKRGGGVKGCPHYDVRRSRVMSDAVLAEVQDIEDLCTLGKRHSSCPYYAARGAIANAQVVAVPYNILLHAGTREASGVSLTGNVVVLDEAHNIIDTITALYSVMLTGQTVLRAHGQLSRYLDKYRTRLNPTNTVYIKQLLFFLAKFRKLLEGKLLSQTGDASIWAINTFLFRLELDNINVFKLAAYCRRAGLVKKLNGFVDRFEGAAEQGAGGAYVPRGSALEPVVAFLTALQSDDTNGRIVVNINQDGWEQATLRFVVLSAAEPFAEVLREARAVVLCGGTMAPHDDFLRQLVQQDVFRLRPEDTRLDLKAQAMPGAGGEDARLDLKARVFSCGHVIPACNLLAAVACTGPTGKAFDFSFAARRDPAQIAELGRLVAKGIMFWYPLTQIAELGRLVANVCQTVPAGIVCFFPSYDFEDHVYKEWKRDGTLARIGARKKVFREERGGESADSILAVYGAAITAGRGAVLFSVVGGKMSEGINFKDDMGRCVIMVGLPYANIKSAELQEKMRYLDTKAKNKEAGRAYYENLCMRAVNQSIGRAIRHRDDYAGIVLVDQRYGQAGIHAKLPAWIGASLDVHTSFGQLYGALQKFFKGKRQANNGAP